MDGYLKRRLSNPAYGGGAMNESSAYKRFAFEQSVNEQKPTDSHPLQMARYNAAKCWEGYERVPGTAEYADGSCRKKGSGGKKKKKKKGDKKKAAKKEGDSSSSSESDSDDGKKKKSKD